MKEDGAPISSVYRTPIVLCRRGLHIGARSSDPLVTAVEELGLNVEAYQDGPIPLDPASVVWIQNNANWFPKICRQLEKCPPAARPLVVHWFTEPLPPPRAAGLPRPRLHLKEIVKILLRDARITDVYSNAARLKSLMKSGTLDLLVVSTPGRQQFLAEQGIQARFVPLGYSRVNQGHYLGLERTRDVIFIGIMVPRRRKLLKRLRKAGIQVDQMGSWFDPACWGESRSRILNQTKIFLNLARHPGELPGLRLLLGMANKCLVVSEPIYEPGPYVPGEHFVTCSIEDMPDVIRYYLNHPEERQKIVDAGYRLATESITQERSLKKLIALIDEKLSHRARY